MKKYINKVLDTFYSSYLVSNRYECIKRENSTRNITRKAYLDWYEKLLILLNINNKVEIPFMDINVNTMCTLKCRHCDQGVPYLKHHKCYNSDSVVQNLDKMLNLVDFIYQVSIIGGEPFINKDIDKVINYCANQSKIGSIIIVTNGTIYPDQKVLDALKKKNVILFISHYDLKDDTNRRKLMDYCFKKHIKMHYDKNQGWVDLGKPEKRYYTKHQLICAYKDCFFRHCLQFNNGKLYHCSKMYYFENEKSLKLKKSECINVNNISSKKEMHQRLRLFYKTPYLSTCDYCNYGKDLVKIKPGEQLNN